MNITPITRQNQTFKSKLTVHDFKTDKILKYDIPTKTYLDISEKFASTDMLNIRPFYYSGTNGSIERLKNFTKFFADSVGANFHESLTYPDATQLSLAYKSGLNETVIDVPEHFSIKLEA